jgi:hypothetical protein
MLAFDRFMWAVPLPAGIVALAVTLGVEADSDTKRAVVVITAILAIVAYALQARYLIQRRRLWRPPSTT